MSTQGLHEFVSDCAIIILTEPTLFCWVFDPELKLRWTQASTSFEYCGVDV